MPNLTKPAIPGVLWSDLSSYETTNRKGFVVVPTVVPVGDAEITDEDLKFMIDQARSQAVVVQRQAQSIAEHEVLSYDRNTNPQQLAAEREVFSFGIQIVVGETAAATAMEIAKDALLSQNYLALGSGTWANWCDMAMEVVRRCNRVSKRELAEGTMFNIKSWILSGLPAVVHQLKDNPVISPNGTEIGIDYICSNPGILSEAASAIKSLDKAITEGNEEARGQLEKLLSAYADLPQKEARAILRGRPSNPPDKQGAIKETYDEVDQSTGELKTRTRYILVADTEPQEHWIETQLSARYEFTSPISFHVNVKENAEVMS